MSPWMFDPEFFDEINALILPSNGAGDPATDPDWAEIERQRRGLLRTAKILDIQSAESGDASLIEDAQKFYDAESALPRQVDPRSPIQKLLERFDLEEDQAAREEAKDWNDKELPENKREKEKLLREAELIERDIRTNRTPDDKVEDDRDIENRLRDSAETIDDKERTVAVYADAHVHISASAIPFPRWHLDAEGLQRVTFYKEGDTSIDTATKRATKKDDTPRRAASLVPADEYRTALPYPKPGRTIEELETSGIPKEGDTVARIVECIRLARSMIPEVPVKGKGDKGVAPAGTLGHVDYQARGTEGWMYVENPDGEYGTWFRNELLKSYYRWKQRYEELKDEEGATVDAKMTARYNMRQAAACVSVAYQEGAPSAINTYDGLVLSWGIGIAGPGKLPKTFYEITKDPRVYKAFYLCGFHYDGFVQGDEHHGAYQIVDLESDPPGIVYKDQYDHAPGAKPYDFQGHAYKVLKYFTSQPKLLHLLIQLAKDPLTRETILAPNFRMIQGFVAFVGGEHIETDALHIFAAMVKQNWGFGPEIVLWAVQRFSDAERAIPLEPGSNSSVEKDKAIAKGIVRFLMGRLQLQRWQRAIKTMKLEDKGKITDYKAGAKDKFLYDVPATTEFGFQRLIDNYWTQLKKGPSAQTTRPEITGPGLAVEDFPEVASPKSDTNYIWIQSQNKPGQPASKGKTLKYYDLGPLHQLDLLFPHEEIQLIGFQGDSVVIKDRGKLRTVPQDLKPQRWGVK